MKLINQLLLLLLFVSVLSSCRDTKQKNKENGEQPILNEIETAKQRFVTETEDIHKKEKFMSEDVVSYEISYELNNMNDVLQVKAATDLSIIEVISKHFGKTYYKDNHIYIDQMANMDDQVAKRFFLMVYFYHAVFHLNENAYTYYPVEETFIMDERFKYIEIDNQDLHLAFFPKQVKFFIEDRTQMLKGLSLETNQLTNARSAEKIYLQYDRFITVNHVPVSLTWKFFKQNNIEKDAQFGEAKITKIRFYNSNQLQLSLPKDAIKVKTPTFL